MSYSKFIHLRNHSAYSLAEGAIKMKDLIALGQKNNMPAMAITDTNNMFGALEFALEASGVGIQPIMGLQVSITPIDVDKYNLRPNPDALVLLAKNEQGYLNIMEIVSKSFIETETGFLPQVNMKTVAKLSDGIICLTGGNGGTLNRLVKTGQIQKSEEFLDNLNIIFKGNLYIELHRHGIKGQIEIENKLLDMAYDKVIPIVATNEVFYADKDMYAAHDALLCIAQGVVVDTKDRRRVSKEHYFKTANEMIEQFVDLPEAIENTIEIAKRCHYKTPTTPPLLPQYPYLEGRTENEALCDLTINGLKERLGVDVYIPSMDDETKNLVTKEYMDRMEYELKIIIEMGFPGYFLIVADFIKWSKDNEIPVGPGRGSGAGSIVAWALKVTNLDPIRFGLLFERFLNPERVSMPDFDIDFCQDRRDEVIFYVQKQYGRDKVAQIITFGKLQARAVIRDVGRVLAIPYAQVDRIGKLIPNNPANPMTLSEAIESEPALQNERDSDPTIALLIDLALKLEGLYRHASTHAAGLVIGDRPLHQLVPLYLDPKSDIPVTQFNMKFVEQAGLVKFDFLGLKTLTIIKMAVNLANERSDVKENINIETIPIDDCKTYKMLSKGDTVGVFQLESAGMRKVLMQMKPDRLEDIIAVVALYRPGPMENISTYIDCKHERKEVSYLHELLEPVLKETFGIPVYQEQVMQMAQVIAGYTLGGADLLRRAMGKKAQAEMDVQRKIFKDGAAKHNNVDGKLSDAIFDQINAFAGYGFNKSHAAAYALIAYQTGWLKANYPVELMAASMTYDLQNTDKLSMFKQDLEKSGIELLPPDVNKSTAVFSVEKVDLVGDSEQTQLFKPITAMAVRYAMSGLKNVGEKAICNIVKLREQDGEFKDLYDFVERVEHRDLNKRMMENLAKAGAFDSLVSNRKQVLDSIQILVKYGASVQNERDSAQDNLFGDSISEMSRPQLKDTADFNKLDRLREEYQVVGFYLSAHPLSIYRDKWKRLGVDEFSSIFNGKSSGDAVRVCGILSSVRYITTQKGKPMAIADFTDATGAFSILFFDETISKVRDSLQVGNYLVINCSKSVRGVGEEKEVRLIGSVVKILEDEIASSADGLQISLMNSNSVDKLKQVFAKADNGLGIVNLILDTEIGVVEMNLGEKYKVNGDLRRAINDIDGVSEVWEI